MNLNSCDHGTTGVDKFEVLHVEQSYDPTWSPDGTTIMFSHLELTPEREFVAGLQSIMPGSSGQHWISHDNGHQAGCSTALLD